MEAYELRNICYVTQCFQMCALDRATGLILDISALLDNSSFLCLFSVECISDYSFVAFTVEQAPKCQLPRLDKEDGQKLLQTHLQTLSKLCDRLRPMSNNVQIY